MEDFIPLPPNRRNEQRNVSNKNAITKLLHPPQQQQQIDDVVVDMMWMEDDYTIAAMM